MLRHLAYVKQLDEEVRDYFERARADLIGMDSVIDPNAGAKVYASYVVEAGRPGPVLA